MNDLNVQSQPAAPSTDFSPVVGDLVRIDDRFWDVLGIHLGAVGQESVICLRAIGRTEAIVQSPMYVPEFMLRRLVLTGHSEWYSLNK